MLAWGAQVLPMIGITSWRLPLFRVPDARWETPVDGGKLRSPHEIDVPFVFDNVQLASERTGGGPDAVALADKVSDAWIAFARSGTPNTPKLPRWPAFEARSRATMVIDNTCVVVNDPIREQRQAMFRALGFV